MGGLHVELEVVVAIVGDVRKRLGGGCRLRIHREEYVRLW